MNSKLEMSWHTLRSGSPGRRFQDYYEVSRRRGKRGWPVARVVRLLLAVIATAVGVILVFLPGPAIFFFAIAGALLATESLWVARFLDWSEVRLRRLSDCARQRWRRLSRINKVAVAIALGVIVASSAYASYRVLFTRA